MRFDRRGIVLAIYFIVTAAAMVTMGQPDSVGWYLISVPFMGLAMAPVAWLCLTKSDPVLSGVGAVLSAGFGIWGYADTAWRSDSDAQDGLVFLVVPVLQTMFAFAWISLAWIVRWLSAKAD